MREGIRMNFKGTTQQEKTTVTFSKEDQRPLGADRFTLRDLEALAARVREDGREDLLDLPVHTGDLRRNSFIWHVSIEEAGR